MEFYEAINSLYTYKPDNPHGHYVCLECDNSVHLEWAIWRHIDNKHSNKLYELSGQAHGWNNARMGWK